MSHQNAKFTFKIVLQKLPNIACSGFGLRLLLKAIFEV